MSIEARVRPAAGEADGALVLFHGRGVDEQDLFPLLDVFDPERRLAGATPRGPLALPPSGRHWYAVQRIGFPEPETFHATYGEVSVWLDDFGRESGIGWERTVLGGFSQGAVMAWALGLGAGRPRPAGVLALSGFIPTVEGFELDLTGLEGFSAAIGHGFADPVIGIEWGRDACDRLEAAGADVLYRESPMGHTIDPRFIGELEAWVRERTT